jgi:acetyl esterase/lipase
MNKEWNCFPAFCTVPFFVASPRNYLFLVLCPGSLHLCFAPSTYLFWKVAVGVTEFPYIPVALTLLSIWFIKYTHGPLFENGFLFLRDAGTLLGMAALILFARPIIQGVVVGFRLSLLFRENDQLPFAPHRMFRAQKRAPKPQTLVYKKTGGLQLSLDLYPANSPYDRPCVLVIHGGGWDSGSNRQIDNLNYYLAHKGYHVAAINYRLAPAYCSPAPVEDLCDAVDLLKSRAGEFNINAHNLILLGRSAGGQVALLAAYTALKDNVRGVISFYAPADMVWGWSIPGNPLVLDSRAVMAAYIGGTCEALPDKFHASSPIEFVSRDSPPTLLIHGANDCMVSPKHSTRLKAKLEKYHVDHLLVTLPWATHGCDYNLYGPSGQISTYAIERFLEKHTK